MNEMKINGVDIDSFNARLLSFNVSGTKFSNNCNVNDNRLYFPKLYSRTYQQKTLTVTLTFRGTGKTVFDRLSSLHKSTSAFDKAVFADELLISLPDGFVYRAVCQSIGDLAPDGDGIADVTYTFSVLQCLPFVSKTIYNGIHKINNEGNVECDCIIEATNNTDVAQLLNFRTFGFKYSPLQPGETLIINGFDNTLTVSGVNVFNNFISFIEFPRLPPGSFNFYTSCYSADPQAITIKVSFYPTFL